MNARCPCTPPSTVETFGEEISAEACSGKEIAGLLRKPLQLASRFLVPRPHNFSENAFFVIIRTSYARAHWRRLLADATVL